MVKHSALIIASMPNKQIIIIITDIIYYLIQAILNLPNT